MKKIEWLKYSVAVSLLLFITAGAQAGIINTEQFSGNIVKVTQKYPNCIVVKNHSLDLPSKYIIVTPTSIIKDINGSTVSIENLKLPCAAKLRYYSNRKRPDAELIKLEILEYADKTSTRYKSNKPFIRLPE